MRRLIAIAALACHAGRCRPAPRRRRARSTPGPAPKPGPKILYAKPKTAPQLKNEGIWRAKPILISGTSAYRKGEFLYQDYIYDDMGAKGRFDPADPKGTATFARFNGTYSYPLDEPTTRTPPTCSSCG